MWTGRWRDGLWRCLLLVFVGVSTGVGAQEGVFERRGECFCATLSPTALVRDTERFIRELHDSGYLDTWVDTLTRTAAGQYRVCLQAGARYYLHNASEQRPWTKTALSLWAKEVLGSRLGKLTPESRIRADVGSSPDTIFPLNWQLFEGRAYPLADIEPHGAVTWATGRWASLLGLRLGAPFSHNELRRVDRVLGSIAYLRSSQPAVLELIDTGGVRLHLFPELRRQNSVEGALGFRPSGGAGQKMEFFGNVHLRLENLLRQGERIRGSWVGRGSLRQEVTFSTHFPYLWETAWGVVVSGQATLRSNETYKWLIGGGLSYRWGGWHELQTLVEQQYLHARDTATTLRYWDIVYTGHYLASSASRWFGKITGGIGRRTADTHASLEGRYGVEGSYEQLLRGRWYVSAQLQARGYWRDTAHVSTLEDFPFGGANHFHGLEEHQLTTPQFVYFSLREGYQASERLRVGLLSQVGELAYRAVPRWALSLGGELLLATNAGQFEVGIARFLPWGDWYLAPDWLLHLRLIITF